MSTLSHAKTELDILVKTVEDPIIKPFIPEILALIKKFGESGQSGGSAPYTAEALSKAIKKLCLQEPICPITGHDDEWNDATEMNGETMYQNKRCSALFKYSENEIHYVNAIVKRTQNDMCYCGSFWLSKADYLTGNKDLKISNCLSIKGFPFTPKTFYIDVIEEEVAPDDWVMYVKDQKQLLEVFSYYKCNIPKFLRKYKLKQLLK